MLDQIFALLYRNSCSTVGVGDHCGFMDWTADDSSEIRQPRSAKPSGLSFDCHYDDSSPVFAIFAHCPKKLKN